MRRRETFVSGMVMGMAKREFVDGEALRLRAMLSPDPFMRKRGYPILLASRETADGVNTLVDREHPHLRLKIDWCVRSASTASWERMQRR